MAKIDLEQKLEYLEWASTKTGWFIDPHGKAWFTHFTSDGTICSVAFYHNWITGGNVQLGLATDGSRRGLSKSFIRTVFRYAFDILRVHRITITVYRHSDKDNSNWISQLIRMGGIVEAELIDWFAPGVNGIMLRFTKDSICNSKFGQVVFGDSYEWR